MNREEMISNVKEAVKLWCRTNDIHEVCFYCAQDCKVKYEEFDSDLDAQDFCARYDDVNLY